MSILISENLQFNNIVKCFLRNLNDEIVATQQQPNMVVNVAKNAILDNLGGASSSSIQIKHGAVGNGTGSTSGGSILLNSEIARGPIVYTRNAQVGTLSVFFNTSQASGVITEIGFFGGTSSFTSSNTGTMFNRVLLTSGLPKNENYTLTIDLDIEF